MNIKEIIKLELNGWTKFEIIGLSSIFCLIFVNAIVFADNIIAVISAICGISYTIIAGKGKISCYLFGLISTLCYSYLAFKNGIYGNCLLNIGYYFPMQILGIFAWKRNLNKKTNEIYKTKLQKSELIKVFILTILACISASVILKFYNASFPIMDAVTTILSMLGMFLTVKRCIEQWIVWTIVNSITALMWLKLVFLGSHTISTFVMWSVYLVLGIYFYFKWRKEV